MDYSISRRKWMGQMTTLVASSACFTVPSFAHNTETLTQTDLIKLDSNENPYGPSPKALEAIRKTLSSGNRYAFDEAEMLHKQLAKHMNVGNDQLLLGSGSSQLLQLLAHWIVLQKYPLTYASPTFNILPNQIRELGGIVNEIIMADDFQYDLNRLGKQAEKNPGIIYLVNPNNPTGIKTSANALKTFCKQATSHSYVIIDEAYIEYTGQEDSLVEMIHDNERVIVVKTFSKIYGLAGLRIGYLMAHANTIQKLKPLRIWDNDSLNIVGIAAAKASLNDHTFIRESLEKNKAIRTTTAKALENLGIQTYTSDTNFLLLKIPENKDLESILKKRNILISPKVINGSNYARVTMGSEAEMNTFIKHMSDIY